MPSCGYRWLRLGPLFFQEVQPMPWGGPIIYAHAAANGYDWAGSFFMKFCRCDRVGPSHMHMQLLIATSGPIIVLGNAADALGWAH